MEKMLQIPLKIHTPGVRDSVPITSRMCFWLESTDALFETAKKIRKMLAVRKQKRSGKQRAVDGKYCVRLS